MNGNDTIESLTAAYLEGRLSPEEAERLLETIERDEQARRTLFEMKNRMDGWSSPTCAVIFPCKKATWSMSTAHCRLLCGMGEFY